MIKNTDTTKRSAARPRPGRDTSPTPPPVAGRARRTRVDPATRRMLVEAARSALMGTPRRAGSKT